MSDSTSRRTWLQTLLTMLFGLLAFRISPAAAAATVNLPKAIPAPEKVGPDTTVYQYNSDPYGKVTEYTFDCHGSVVKIVEVLDPATDDPDITTYTYE